MLEEKNTEKDFFISYTHTDRDWATWIAWQIEKAGYSVVYQEWDFRGNFVEQMDRAQRETARTVVAISDAFFQSGFTTAEWSARFAQDPAGRGGRLIPIKVGVVTDYGILRPLIYADITDCDEEEAVERLMNRIKMSLDPQYRPKPAKSPIFPGRKKPAFPVLKRGLSNELPLLDDRDGVVKNRKTLLLTLFLILILAVAYLFFAPTLENRIQVVGGRYGIPGLGSCDFTRASKLTACNGQQSCTISCNNDDACSDPVPHNPNKQCFVDYSCSLQDGIQTFKSKESSGAPILSCPKTNRFDMASAYVYRLMTNLSSAVK